MSSDNPPTGRDEQPDQQQGNAQPPPQGGGHQPSQPQGSGQRQSQTVRGGGDDSFEPHTDIITTTPTIKPTVAKLVLALVLGVIAIGVLVTNPELFGSRETTDIVLLLVQVLLAISVIRLLIKMLVLRRTRYTITSSSVKREYELLFQTEVKEVPFGLVRSHQFHQSRVENLLGHGTIAINRGLGQLEMENVDNPDDIYDTVRRRIDEIA